MPAARFGAVGASLYDHALCPNDPIPCERTLRMTDLARLIASIDRQRTSQGYRAVSELLDWLEASHNIALDPFSLLISREVELGSGNRFYPNVVLEAKNGGRIAIGSGNTFFPAARLLADQGRIRLGDGNEIGEGGIQLKALAPGALIEIGSEGRYMNGAEVTANCRFGSGTQIIGAIRVQNCVLDAGGSYRDPDPDTRGAVLKGVGVARNLTVRQGEVINGLGRFEQENVERQTAYHPKK